MQQKMEPCASRIGGHCGDRVQRAIAKLESRRRVVGELIEDCVRKKCAGQITSLSDEYRRLCGTITFLERLNPSTLDRGRVFVFSSLMLRESFELCCEIPNKEGMHFIVGIERGGTLYGTKIIPFQYSHRSFAGAAGEQARTHRIAIDMHEAAHRLIAIMHSHPGWGPDANRHSGTDMQTQGDYEAGWSNISGIWSRDGYVRFFSHKLRFGVEVCGSGVMRSSEEDNVFKVQ